MSELYRKAVEAAVKAVRQEENGDHFTDEEAKRRIEWHLSHNFAESLKGKGVNPVPDTLFELREWAQYEYLLLLLNDLRRGANFRDHRLCTSNTL